MSTAVAYDRIEAAFARIDTALGHIDTALAATTAPHRELRRRHELLREAAATSLLTIDALIAAHEDVVAVDALDRS